MRVFFVTKFPLPYVLSVLRSITKEVVLELAKFCLVIFSEWFHLEKYCVASPARVFCPREVVSYLDEPSDLYWTPQLSIIF